MSYLWSQEQVDRYFSYYGKFRSATAHVLYETTAEFARSVLPPCLEPAEKPHVGVGVRAFATYVDGVPNRIKRDRAATIWVNARYGDREGTYCLNVIEGPWVGHDAGIVGGREIWGMAKKQGIVDFFDDGEELFAYVERNFNRLIEIEANVGREEGPQPPSKDTTFELRGYPGPNGMGPGMAGYTGVQLLVFDCEAKVKRTRPLSDVYLALRGSMYDPGVGTIVLGDFIEGAAQGMVESWTIGEIVDLDDDPHEYAPYLLGRLYDDWPDLRTPVPKRPSTSVTMTPDITRR